MAVGVRVDGGRLRSVSWLHCLTILLISLMCPLWDFPNKTKAALSELIPMADTVQQGAEHLLIRWEIGKG